MHHPTRHLLALATLCLTATPAYQAMASNQAVETAPQSTEHTEAVDNAFDIELGDASIHVQAESCEKNINLITCENVELAVAVPGREHQTLKLPQMLLPADEEGGNPADTAIRGSLEGGFADGRRSLMLSDVNLDGEEDLVVWSGHNGSYGDPSYTWFIYDPEAKQLVENTALAEMIDGHSFSSVEGKRLLVWYRSGPCERGEKEIELNGNTPAIVERDDYNTCEGEKPLDWRAAPLPEVDAPTGELGPQTAADGSRQYDACIESANGDEPKVRNCIFEQASHENESIDNKIARVTENLDATAVAILETVVEHWTQASAQFCASTPGDTSLPAMFCGLDRLDGLWWATSSSDEPLPPDSWARTAPDTNGALALELGNASVSLQSDGCDQESDHLVCRNAQLRISIPRIDTQIIELPEIRLPDAESSSGFTATVFRGDVSSHYADGMYGLLITDFNEDRIEDLVVWTGNDGAGGSPSYTWFISDRIAGKLVENRRMSDIMQNHAISRIGGNAVYAWYRNDQCVRGDKRISIYDDGPRITERHDYDDCKAPPTAASPAAN